VRVDVPAVLAMAQRGAVASERTISRRYALGEVPAAYAALQRGEIVGRAIVVMGA